MKASRTTFTLSKPELLALLEHASTDETRAHISSLALDFANARIAATDGHRLAILRDGDGPVKKKSKLVLLHRDAAALAARLATKKSVIEIARASISVDGHALAFTAVEAKYPPFDTVIPKSAMAPPALKRSWRFVSLDPLYLAALTKIADATDERGLDIEFGRVLDPIVVRSSGRANQWLVVIMPRILESERGVRIKNAIEATRRRRATRKAAQ